MQVAEAVAIVHTQRIFAVAAESQWEALGALLQRGDGVAPLGRGDIEHRRLGVEVADLGQALLAVEADVSHIAVLLIADGEGQRRQGLGGSLGTAGFRESVGAGSVHMNHEGFGNAHLG